MEKNQRSVDKTAETQVPLFSFHSFTEFPKTSHKDQSPHIPIPD